jgi:hypothetical protein
MRAAMSYGGHYWGQPHPEAPIEKVLYDGVDAAVPIGNEVAVRWLFHLRELYERAIEVGRPRRGEDPAAYLDRVADLGDIDRRLRRGIADNERRSTSYYDRRSYDVLALVVGLTKRLASVLEMPEVAPVGWVWTEEELPGEEEKLVIPREPILDIDGVDAPHPDVAPGPGPIQRQVWLPKRSPGPAAVRHVPPPVHTARRAAALDARADRVLGVLRRHPEGLSTEEVRKKLHMGRAQLRKTLDALDHAGRVRAVGTGSDFRWLRRVETPPKKGHR